MFLLKAEAERESIGLFPLWAGNFPSSIQAERSKR
jgi:hypothetical protein